jgi:hypothetical protein
VRRSGLGLDRCYGGKHLAGIFGFIMAETAYICIGRRLLISHRIDKSICMTHADYVSFLIKCVLSLTLFLISYLLSPNLFLKKTPAQ